MPPRPDVTASYAIPVRRARTLPTASFRFRVAPDTLAVQLSVPTIRVRRGLAPPSHQSGTIPDWMALARHAPCLAHIKKGPVFTGPFHFAHGLRDLRDRRWIGVFSCRTSGNGFSPAPFILPTAFAIFEIAAGLGYFPAAPLATPEEPASPRGQDHRTMAIGTTL